MQFDWMYGSVSAKSCSVEFLEEQVCKMLLLLYNFVDSPMALRVSGGNERGVRYVCLRKRHMLASTSVRLCRNVNGQDVEELTSRKASEGRMATFYRGWAVLPVGLERTAGR